MDVALIFRSVVTFGSLALSLWVLTPSFLPPEMQTEVKRVCDLALEEEVPENTPPPQDFTKWLPCSIIVKGLDIQGGLDLTLEVQVDEAVRSIVQRDIQPLERFAEEKGIKLAEVRRSRTGFALLIAPAEGVSLEQVTTAVNGRLEGYKYENTREESGKSWLVFQMTETRAESIKKQAVEQAREVLENRINATGVKEPQITRKGETGIDLQLPGETDIDRAVAALGTTAQLEFMRVNDEIDQQELSAKIESAKAVLPPVDFNDDRVLSDWMVDNGVISTKMRLAWGYDKQKKQVERTVPYVLFDEVELTGEDVNNARTAQDSRDGSYYVAVDFKPHGAARFGELTGSSIGKRIAIVLDDQVRAAPTVQSRIDGTASITTGEPTVEKQYESSNLLSLVLRTGALPAPVSVGEVRQIGATLGERAVREGSIAAMIGAGLVLVFAAFYYRISGILADISLAMNATLVLAALAFFGATLTLPGICGIALTIGMAVDCNIIIFERIREEIRAGRSISHAIETGFDRAFVAVFDSNVTTLIAGVVLFSYGTGPLRGFAVTLMIGIFTTLFTGVFVSRTLMDLVAARGSSRLSI